MSDETKFTKGEWKIKKGTIDNGGGKFSITTDKWNIATIWVTGDDEETANAKLIAASPSMLKALQEVYDDLKQGAIPNDLSFIEAAIKKATT